MIDVEPLIKTSFQRIFPEPVIAPDWPGVERRVRGSRGRDGLWNPRPGRNRRLAFVIAFVLAAGVLVAAALATGLADRFSAWVSGPPGRPAPAAVQRGFEQRNRAAYASFPAGTKLRLLLSRSVDGTTFSLLGFRNGDAYCLRLIRTDLANGIGRNECLRAEELIGVPALVAGDAWFSIGSSAENITGVFGFAADNVRALTVVRARGSEQVTAVNNVFLSLRAQAAGSGHEHPLPNPVLAVRALLRGGSSLNVPYVSEGTGVIPSGNVPTVPRYFGRPSPAQLPGPATVVAPIAKPRIGWLAGKERRGTPLPRQRFLHVQFGRVIQPDPDDPIRVGVATATIVPPPGAPAAPNLHGRSICVLDFQPLAPATAGAGCTPDPFRHGALALGSFLATPITHFNGLAADGITHVRAYLSSGRIVQAALRDNVFSVALAQGELPGKLVGYDNRNRVAAILALPGNAVATPCPAAVLPTASSRLPAPQPWERLDLATLRVDGHTILGETPAEIEAALGRPTRIIGARQRSNGVPIPELRYGGASQSTVGLAIGFSKKGDRIFANDLTYQSPSLTDPKLGQLLRVQPAKLERELAHSYGLAYRLYLGYGSDPARGCTGIFLRRGAADGISFGLDPYRPSRPYLAINANGTG